MSVSRRLRAVVAASAVTAVLAACGGVGGPQYLTDPKAVLTESTQAMTDLESVHFDASFSADVDMGALSGLGGMPGAPSGGGTAMTLAGELTGGIDFADQAVSASLTIPSMLGFTADVLVVDETAYFRMPMLMGDQWQFTEVAPTEGEELDPAAVADPSQIAEGIDELAAADGVELSMGEPTACADADEGEDGPLCYVVTMNIDLAKAAAAAASAVPAEAGELEGLAEGEMIVELRVGVDDMRWQSVDFELAHPSVEGFTARIAFSGFDEPVDVEPPADAVPMEGMPGMPSLGE